MNDVPPDWPDTPDGLLHRTVKEVVLLKLFGKGQELSENTKKVIWWTICPSLIFNFNLSDSFSLSRLLWHKTHLELPLVLLVGSYHCGPATSTSLEAWRGGLLCLTRETSQLPDQSTLPPQCSFRLCCSEVVRVRETWGIMGERARGERYLWWQPDSVVLEG